MRASAFMIADGILPSNEGRGYVLRRIIRRSVRFGRLIGIERPFLLELLPVVNEIMSDPYAELIEQKSTIEQILSLEEERFGKTLTQGMELLEDEMNKTSARDGKRKIAGDVAFVLYDTYGFPLELTEEIAGEAGIEIGREEFDAAMERQRERARASSKHTTAVISKNVYTELADVVGATKFDGYDLDEEDVAVVSILKDGVRVDSIAPGDGAQIVLSRSPFYAERGGQVGDKGVLAETGVCFEVEDTVYPSGDMIVHNGKLAEGVIKEGMTLHASIDAGRRKAIRRHHTATHLLHEALIRVLGAHVRQAGSLVTPTFLRFDYNHFAPMTTDEIAAVERIMYEQILANLPVETHIANFDEARKLGAKALFEEKYGDVVRVLKIPGYSTELCGGTHVRNTGEIGLVKIIRDEGIGSGVRRINAVAGMISLGMFQSTGQTLRQLSEIMGGDMDSIVARTEDLLDEKKILEKKNQDLMLRSMLENAGQRLERAEKIDDLLMVAERFNEIPKDILRQIGDRIKQAEPRAVILLAGVESGQVTIIGMASDELVKRGVHAGNLVKEVAGILGGSGGGKPGMGQAGSKDAGKLDEALAAAADIVRKQLAK